VRGEFDPSDFNSPEGWGTFFHSEKKRLPKPDQVDKLREIMRSQLNPPNIRQAREILSQYEMSPETEIPSTMYISETGFVMCRSSQGNPMVLYKLTAREFYCVLRGLEIYE
jgi:hypothetical protein